MATAGMAGLGLKLLSFNAENLSEKKYKKKRVVDVILKIIEDFDLTLILEMEDHQNVLIGLVNQLNERYKKRMKRGGGSCPVEYMKDGVFAGLSDCPQGREGRPEEYAFIYRKDKVNILDYYQSKSKQFERPPFPIFVQAIGQRLKFFIVPIHTRPGGNHVTINELNALPLVFYRAKKKFGAKYGLIMGDLNCGGSYVSRKRYEELSLYTKDDFKFWIDYDQDTTTGHYGHAYDRIITNTDFTRHVVEGSARVVKFDEEQGLSHKLTKEVSDHYPVTITLQ